MRLLVCGSRSYRLRFMIDTVLNGIYLNDPDGVTLMHGAAQGADSLADQWGRETLALDRPNDPPIGILPFPADWKDHGDQSWCQARCYLGTPIPGAVRELGDTCFGAGPRRNQRMLDEGRPDLVVAFIDKPIRHSHGTRDMVDRAKNAGIDTKVIQG